LQVVAPSSSWYVPPAQGVHWAAPAAANVPGLQSIGAVLPVEQNAPAGQSVHWPAEPSLAAFE